ncbi:MAG: VWA domain-containing protein [Proteobacteria bacterium]|nr:VWA domain-containing protein [Pseudomonadota bacterium]
MHTINTEKRIYKDQTNPLVEHIIEFVRFVRDNGFKVGIKEECDALIVAKYGNVVNQKRLKWGLRSLLCNNCHDWERFDTLFETYWFVTDTKTRAQSKISKSGGKLEGTGTQDDQKKSEMTADIDQLRQENSAAVAQGGVKNGASAGETHTKIDFRFLDDLQQMSLMEQMVERLARRMRRRLIRRQRDQRQGRRLNLRRTIRHSLSHGGTPLELIFRKKKKKLPRLILLLDVSRSMSLYSYLFLRFARGIVGAFKNADAFVYHTRLVHVTDALIESDINIVKKKLALMSAGWSGGTRIGECLEKFNQDYGRHMITSHTVVIIFSDGLDTGTTESLTEQLSFIKKRARKLVWLNPLLGRDGYEPIAKSMQAALPLLDLFASAHNLESLMALESHLVEL